MQVEELPVDLFEFHEVVNHMQEVEESVLDAHRNFYDVSDTCCLLSSLACPSPVVRECCHVDATSPDHAIAGPFHAEWIVMLADCTSASTPLPSLTRWYVDDYKDSSNNSAVGVSYNYLVVILF